MRDAERDLYRFAEAHHRVFHIDHARAEGMTDDEIEHRIAAQRWQRVRHEVFCVTGSNPTWEGQLLAACWTGGPRAHVSHRAAAALWGLPGGEEVLEITAPRGRRARHVGLRCHKSTRIESADVTERHGIPVSTIERTLVDLAGVVRSDAVIERSVQAAVRLGFTTHQRVRATVTRIQARGRPGVARMRRVMGLDLRVTESDPEAKVLQLLRRYQLPTPSTQHKIRLPDGTVVRTDFAFTDELVILEYESDEHHSTDAEIAANADRRNALREIGWLVIEIRKQHLRRGAFGPMATRIRNTLNMRRKPGNAPGF